MTTYTIGRLSRPEHFTPDVKAYFLEEAPRISHLFGDVFNWKNVSVFKMARDYVFLICRRDNEIRGFMICYFYKSPFDPKVKILQQLSFNVKPDSGRTAYHLFHKFVDIGRHEANHVITMLTTHSNIKPSTLEKLGFKELETYYRLET